MAVCKDCGRSTWRLDLVDGVCANCAPPTETGSTVSICGACKRQVHGIDPAIGICGACAAEFDGDTDSEGESEEYAEELAAITLTTESAHNLPVSHRLGIVTSEVAYGMHLFKDIAALFRDTFGGRSKVTQNALRDARNVALDELRQEAHELGANAVVGIAFNYSDISGGGRNMLFLVASGTAVKLEVKP